MRRILARRVSAIVTTGAIAGDVDMIEVRWHPTRRVVAVVAVVAADNVIGVFASRRHAVVTRTASSQDIRVIDREYRIPRCCVVAVLAGICYENMRRNFSSRIGTVVTVDAIARDIRVVEYSRQPCACIVAVVTLLTGSDMRWCFAGCLNTIVAGITATGHRCVVHERNDVPCRRDMAIAALFRRHHMIWRLVGGTHNAAGRMAGAASRLCRTEGRARVAGLATYVYVGTIQYETGTEVIKCLFLAESRYRQQKN